MWNPGLYDGLNPGLKVPGNGAKPLNGVLDSKLPSLFQSELSFHALFHPLFQLALLFQLLNGVFPFHAPGKAFQLFGLKPYQLWALFHAENGVFQLLNPWNPGKVLLNPKPENGAWLFQFHGFGNELFQLLLKLPFQPVFQFDGELQGKPGNPNPVAGKFDANGVLNMVCFLLWCTFSGAEVFWCDHREADPYRRRMGGIGVARRGLWWDEGEGG